MKSGGNLFYRFRKITDEYSFFYMQTRIPTEGAIEEVEVEDKSLDGIMSLHTVLDDQNILLNFSGNFTQETLINLLAILEKQLQGTVVLKMKVFNLMVEMLQNIVKHADNYVHNNISGKHAIFYISEGDDRISFTTGNYILNSRVEKLEKRLEKINSLTKDKLNEFYNECLYNFEKDSDTHSGLGLIDIKIKSKSEYDYDFYKIDEDYSFFSLRVHVKKMRTSITPYILQATEDSPEIVLDSNNSIFRFHGRSYMENAKSFYRPCLEWLHHYLSQPNDLTEIHFSFEFIATSTMKQLARIFLVLEKLSNKSKIIVKWHYKKGDHSMMEAGIRFTQALNIDMNLIELND